MIAEVEDNAVVEEVAQTTKVRSDKQVEASRVNGAKSKGPVTCDGKLRSRKNALRHGILARTLPAETTILVDRRELNDLLRNLKEDLKPVSQLELNVVEDIAATTMRLQTVLRMIALQENRDYGGGVMLENQRFDDAESRRGAEVLCRIAECLAKRAALDLTEAERKLAVNAIWRHMDQYAEKVRELKEELAELRSDGEPDEAKLKIVQAKLSKAQSDDKSKGGRKNGLANSEQVAAALKGERQFSPKQRKRWRDLIEELGEVYSNSAERTARYNELAEEQQAHHLHFPLLGETPQMATLYKYEARLRNQLRRLYEDLDRVRALVREE